MAAGTAERDQGGLGYGAPSRCPGRGQLAVLAGFASSIRWARAPTWGYLLLAASLLAVGIAGLAVTAGTAGHGR